MSAQKPPEVIDLSTEIEDFLTTRTSGHRAYHQLRTRFSEGQTILDLRSMRLVGKSFLDGLSSRLRDAGLAQSVLILTDDERTTERLRQLSEANRVCLKVITSADLEETQAENSP